MTREAEIESMARAIAETCNGGKFEDARWYNPDQQECWRNAARAALSALDGLAGPCPPKEAAQDMAMREKIKDMRRLFRSCAKGFFSADYALGYEEALEHVLGKPAASPSAVDVPREGDRA